MTSTMKIKLNKLLFNEIFVLLKSPSCAKIVAARFSIYNTKEYKGSLQNDSKPDSKGFILLYTIDVIYE